MLRLRRELETIKSQYEILRSASRPESDNRVPAPALDRVAQFRERLRQLSPIIGRVGQSSEPKLLLAQQELRAECERLQIYRLEDPGTYGKCLAAYYEQLVEGMSPPCDETQKAAVGRLLSDAMTRFSGISEATTGERLLAELRLEAEVHGKLADLLGQPLEAHCRANTVCNFFEIASTRGYLGMPAAAQSVALQWANGIGIDNSQYPVVERVASEFMEDAWSRQCRVTESGCAVYGTREFYSLREQALQAQVEALRRLSPYLTPEQLTNLKNFQVREYLFLKLSPQDK